MNEAKSLLSSISVFHERHVYTLCNVDRNPRAWCDRISLASHRQCPPKALEQPQDVVAGDGWLPFRMYYGPELISDTLAKWAKRYGVELMFIQPGRPMQNGYIERFNRTYREEVLNAYVFETLGEVRRMTAEWLVRYNEQRPHESLGDLSPRQYLMAISTKSSTSDWS
jgi:putative transposase